MSSHLVSIRFKNNDGYGQSITHYYHFLFAALFPLIDYHLKHPTHKIRVITDVGPMKRFLCELPLGVVEILSEKVKPGPPTGSTSGSKRSASSMSSDSAEITLQGYDNFNQTLYDSNDLIVDRFKRHIMTNVLDFFDHSIPPYLRQSPSLKKVILIERKTETYFRQAYADKQPAFWTSGSQRRSIANHSDLSTALGREFGNDFAGVSLEGTSLSFQYLVFNSARVVIAQHGGALSNIIFMNPEKSHVVEISPPWGRQDNHFLNLAEAKGVGYARVLQSGDHSDVEVSEICEIVRTLVTDRVTA